MVRDVNFSEFRWITHDDFLQLQNFSTKRFITKISLSSSLPQHHQRQSARKPQLPVREEVLPAPAVEISSKERLQQQRQRLARTEPELDPAACGDSTQTTAPESKCKWN